jgi:hypothetical protein
MEVPAVPDEIQPLGELRQNEGTNPHLMDVHITNLR